MATARSQTNRYGRSSRFYDTPDGTFPSVTTILSSIGKPALIQWAANTERDAVSRAAASLWDDLLKGDAEKMTREAYLVSLQKRIGQQKAHERELAKAAEIGSQVHRLIEWNMRKELGQEVGPEPKIVDKALWSFMIYEDWRSKVNLAPMLCECTVWSKRYGYAGTLDWAGWIDHEGERVLAVGDWKTGKAIYPEARLQSAAYVHALVEMGHAAAYPAGCIVRLPKTESETEFEVMMIAESDMKRNFKTFLSVLDLWKWQAALEEDEERKIRAREEIASDEIRQATAD